MSDAVLANACLSWATSPGSRTTSTAVIPGGRPAATAGLPRAAQAGRRPDGPRGAGDRPGQTERRLDHRRYPRPGRRLPGWEREYSGAKSLLVAGYEKMRERMGRVPASV